jgi:glycosyltransferase involved in cell wall biosynthesis
MDSCIVMVNLSVLMPVFNAGAFLKESIESILNQTYENFELIILDDGSTDESVEIVNQFLKKDSRIKFYRNPINYGVAISRNILVKLAKYDIIAWMDADDIAYPNRLEKEIKTMNEDNSIDLVCSQIDIINTDGTFRSSQKRMNYSLYYDMHFFCSIPNPTVMCKKKAITDSGGYHINMPPTEDFDLWSRLINKYRICKIEEPLLKYRISPNSISNVVYKDVGNQNTQEVIKKSLNYFCPKIKITKNQLLLFQEEFKNIEKIRIVEIISFFYKLKKLNKRILNENNPNINLKDLNKSISEKKKRLILFLNSKIRIYKTLFVLIFSLEIYYFIKLILQFTKSVWQKYV